MKTNFQMMMKLKNWYPKQRSIISNSEVNFVRDILKVEKRTIIELRNLRDFVVLWNNRKGVDYENFEQERKELDKMSAICGVIDGELWNRGQEV